MTNRFVTMIALLVAFTLSGFAQDAAGLRGGQQLQERLQKIQERLELTPEQIDQARPIILDELQQLKAVRDKYSDDQSRRGRLKMVRESQRRAEFHR